MNKHIEFFEQLDHLLAEEDAVLEGLRKAADKGWYTQREIDDRFAEYHELRMLDLLGVAFEPLPEALDMPS